jgi:hypothetical protein
VYELSIELDEVLELKTIADIERLGISTADFSSLQYKACQPVGDAAYFMGFKGMLVPSARGPFRNLVLFSERVPSGACEVVGEQPIDWVQWRANAQRGD